MVIWSGLGLLLPAMVLVGLILMQGSVDLVAGDGIYCAPVDPGNVSRAERSGELDLGIVARS